jgi:hypothetical protein
MPHSNDHFGPTRLSESAWLSIVVVLGAAVTAVIAALLWPAATIELMRENGPVENATVVLYIAGLVLVWAARHPNFGKISAAAASVLLFACVAREISLRRQLLAAAGYETSGSQLSAWPNVLAAAVAVAVLPALLWLTWRYARGALHGLVRRKPFALTLVVAFLCIAFAELFDHLLKVEAADIGQSASKGYAVAFALEETLEMMFPVLLFIAARQTDARWAAPWRRVRK